MEVRTRAIALGREADRQEITAAHPDILLYRITAQYLRPPVRIEVDRALNATVLLLDEQVHPDPARYRELVDGVFQDATSGLAPLALTEAERQQIRRDARVQEETDLVFNGQPWLQDPRERVEGWLRILLTDYRIIHMTPSLVVMDYTLLRAALIDRFGVLAEEFFTFEQLASLAEQFYEGDPGGPLLRSMLLPVIDQSASPADAIERMRSAVVHHLEELRFDPFSLLLQDMSSPESTDDPEERGSAHARLAEPQELHRRQRMSSEEAGFARESVDILPIGDRARFDEEQDDLFHTLAVTHRSP